jgi:hypothetical protein
MEVYKLRKFFLLAINYSGAQVGYGYKVGFGVMRSIGYLALFGRSRGIERIWDSRRDLLDINRIMPIILSISIDRRKGFMGTRSHDGRAAHSMIQSTQNWILRTDA